MGDEGYLSPRPADYDLDPSLRQQGPQGRHDPPKGPPEHKQRFDSGVADLEMHRMSMDSRPKSSAMYEYIDSGSHYEDIPGHLMGRSVSHMPNGQDEVRKSVVSDSRSVITDVTSDTDDTAAIFRTSIDKKRRYNPLYEPNTEATPTAYARRQKEKQVDGLERHLRIQCCFLLIISIFAVAALALSLYLLFFEVLDQNNRIFKKIEILEESNKNLSHENEGLKVIITAAGFNTSLLQSPLLRTLRNTSEAVLEFEEQLNSLNKKVIFTQNNLSEEINSLQSSVNSQLLNISKMPGPQGPRGVANLSTCTYSNHTTQSAPSSVEFSTMFLPDANQLKKKIAMFATCTITGATTSSLDIKAISPSEIQYRCICSGQIDDDRRKCVLHLLLCPRES